MDEGEVWVMGEGEGLMGEGEGRGDGEEVNTVREALEGE